MLRVVLGCGRISSFMLSFFAGYEVVSVYRTVQVLGRFVCWEYAVRCFHCKFNISEERKRKKGKNKKKKTKKQKLVFGLRCFVSLERDPFPHCSFVGFHFLRFVGEICPEMLRRFFRAGVFSVSALCTYLKAFLTALG